MEAFIRDSIERQLDRIIEEVSRPAFYTFEIVFSSTVKSIEDATFGYVVGRIIEFSGNLIDLIYHRKPTQSESQEIGKILTSRALEIYSMTRK